MSGIFDDGIDAEEMAVILGITEEIEEEAKTKLSEDPLTPEEMLKSGNEIMDEEYPLSLKMCGMHGYP